MSQIDPQYVPLPAEQEAKTAPQAVWSYMTSVKHIQHKDGRLDLFDRRALEQSIRTACELCKLPPEAMGIARHIADLVIEQLSRQFDGIRTPTTADVRELTTNALRSADFEAVAQAYMTHQFRTPEPTPSFANRESAPPVVTTEPPRRHRLNEERKAITHKFQIGSHEGYLTVGLYDDTRQPGEIFLTMSKEGSIMSGLVDAFATSISIGLQYGVPLKVYVNKFANMRFEPSGPTQNPNIPQAKSIVDYVFRWLALKFLTPEERQILLNASEESPASFDRQPPLIES